MDIHNSGVQISVTPLLSDLRNGEFYIRILIRKQLTGHMLD